VVEDDGTCNSFRKLIDNLPALTSDLNSRPPALAVRAAPNPALSPTVTKGCPQPRGVADGSIPSANVATKLATKPYVDRHRRKSIVANIMRQSLAAQLARRGIMSPKIAFRDIIGRYATTNAPPTSPAQRRLTIMSPKT
jgi:hypothetical protein